MAKDEKRLPSGIGGLTRYDVETKGFRIKPEEVVGVVVALIVLEIALFYYARFAG